MANFKLNGKDVEFRDGELLIEAAARHGSPIPYYCYHPDLSSPANCRMCLVEVVGAPKLVPSCQVSVNDKMEVFTDSAKVEEARNGVMESLLVNHPLDCPICDQAGECKLQQYAYLFGPSASSMEEAKVELDKRKPVAEDILLDQERCISCTRCIRFLEEVTGTGELQMSQRTNHSSVDIYPGKLIENDYSGNVVDMCPVGALTNKSFRFDSRVWYLSSQDTTCSLCSRGCSTTADWRAQRKGLPLVRRIRSRRNVAVNASWICDEGRNAHAAARGDARPTTSQVDGADSTLEIAQAAMAELLASHAGSTGWLGVLASGSEINEDLSALAEFARAADAKVKLVVPAMEDGDEDAILRRKDKAANRAGARLLGFGEDEKALASCKVLIVVDADLRTEGGLESAVVKKAAEGSKLVAMLARERDWAEGADVMLPIANAFEGAGSFVNFDGILQAVAFVVPAPGDCRAVARQLADVASAGEGSPNLEVSPEARLAALCEKGAPFAGVSAEKLDQWGCRLPADGKDAEIIEAPLQLFSSAPRTYGEGEYLPFLQASTPPSAVHVAGGAPTRIGMNSPQAGAGIELPRLGENKGDDAAKGES